MPFNSLLTNYMKMQNPYMRLYKKKYKLIQLYFLIQNLTKKIVKLQETKEIIY